MKLTTAQTWLAHSLEVILIGAAMSGTIAGYQMVASGNYDWQSICAVIGAAAIAVIAKGLSSTILSNVNLIPAIMDTLNELKASRNATQSPAQPLHVIIHNAPSTAPDTALVPATTPIIDTPTRPMQAVQVDIPLHFGDTAVLPAVQAPQ